MTGGEKRQQFMSQITHATGVVYNQLGRLKLLDRKFASMETSFLEQIAANIKAGNNARAKILATELINVRRLRRNTQHTGLALEAVVIRFSTINEFAAILDTIDPTIEMIKGIQTDLTRPFQPLMKYSPKSRQSPQTCSSTQISRQTPESRLRWTQRPFQSLTRLKDHLRTRQKRGSQRFQLAFPPKNERMHQLKRLRYWLKARLVDQKVD